MQEEKGCCRCSCKKSWILVASLAVNFFLIGLLTAPLIGRPLYGDNPPPPSDRLSFVFDKVADGLVPEEAKKLKDIFEEERRGMRLNREAIRNTIEKATTLLEAEKPDLDEIHKTLDAIPNISQNLHERMVRAFTRTAQELSPESRRLIAEKIKKMPPPPGE